LCRAPAPERGRRARGALAGVRAGPGRRRRSAGGAEPGDHAVDVALEHVATDEVPAGQLVPLVGDAGGGEPTAELTLTVADGGLVDVRVEAAHEEDALVPVA